MDNPYGSDQMSVTYSLVRSAVLNRSKSVQASEKTPPGRLVYPMSRLFVRKSRHQSTLLRRLRWQAMPGRNGKCCQCRRLGSLSCLQRRWLQPGRKLRFVPGQWLDLRATSFSLACPALFNYCTLTSSQCEFFVLISPAPKLTCTDTQLFADSLGGHPVFAGIAPRRVGDFEQANSAPGFDFTQGIHYRQNA